MNLLTDDWIPVRPQLPGAARQISLQTLLCENEHWELALPRDDMELAALQLLICMVQVLLPPADEQQWRERIVKPLDANTLNAATKEYQKWFQLDHPEHPFMQVRGVKAKEATPMDKLFAGLDSSTNSRFVNQADMANGLCFGCVAMALYNQANSAPSYGGGFKFGLRGSCPVSTFAQGMDLRTTLWLNLLTEETIGKEWPEWKDLSSQAPTWVDPIKEKSTIPAAKIGLLRGLFWQPGHTELARPKSAGRCSCCSNQTEQLFTGFYKAKFNYTIEGLWPHPHSPQVISVKKGSPVTRYVSFTQPIPAWTQLSRYVVKRNLNQVGKKEQAQKPAPIIQQLERYLRHKAESVELLAGGYRNNQAAILERRHEILTLSQGWEKHTPQIHQLIGHALQYKTTLRKKLFICSKGIKEKNGKVKGAGLDLHEVGESQFYRRSEDLMLRALADIKFDNPLPTYVELDKQLSRICEAIFEELTNPYQHDPELFRTMAIARRSLRKELKENRYDNPEEDAA